MTRRPRNAAESSVWLLTVYVYWLMPGTGLGRVMFMQLTQAKTDISAWFEISSAVIASQQIWIPIKWESRCLLMHRLSDNGPGLRMGKSVLAVTHRGLQRAISRGARETRIYAVSELRT
ncbi:hypothetical protein F4801DRAFT_291944 [Xylaria longipes]|nr:hypothetical protein F4801DRAFT_291944 [Xylaria longipes]